jgi:hypothetical protein
MPTLLVSCTDRKTLTAKTSLNLRNLSSRLSLQEATAKWLLEIQKSCNTGGTKPLRDLYWGEYWKTALEAEEFANVHVVSAGLGIATLDTMAPGYASTFASGSPDSVLRFSDTAKPEIVRSEWWAALTAQNKLAKNWTSKTAEVVLVALSSSYQQALSSDLKMIARSGKQVIVMSGSKQVGCLKGVENIHHIVTGQWLRMVLGGSTPCVGIKFALHILQADKWHSVDEVETELKKLERQYLNGKTDKLPVFERRTQTDAEVKSWIMELLKTKRNDGVKPSKSGFLLEFRNAGYACEQKRFGALYEEVLSR